MKRTSILFLCVLFLLLAGPAAAGDDGPIVIGVAYPVAQHDEDSLLHQGIDLAVDAVNAAGGVLGRELAIDLRDDMGDASVAMRIAQGFKDSGVNAVIGHWSSSVCYYVEDIYEKNEVVMLTPVAVTQQLFSYEHDYIFRMIPNSYVFAQAIAADLAARDIGAIAIYFADDEFGRDFADALEVTLRGSGTLVLDRVTSVTPGNVRAVTDRWKALGCEAVLIAETMPGVAEPIRLLRANMPGLLFYGGDNFDRLDLAQTLGEAADDLLVATYPDAALDPDFVAAFYAAWGIGPDIHAIAGYQAVMLLADAMEATGSTGGGDIAGYLKGLSDYRTIAGPISFDPDTGEFLMTPLRVTDKP